jgi:hypothetical protein
MQRFFICYEAEQLNIYTDGTKHKDLHHFIEKMGKLTNRKVFQYVESKELVQNYFKN